MALSAETVRKRRSMDQAHKGYGTVATSTTIYKGALVLKRESDGKLIVPTAATGTAGAAFVGVSVSDTKVATETCEYIWGHEELITAKTALTTTYVQCVVIAYDDDSVTTVTAISAAKRTAVGYASDFDSSGNCWVRVDGTATEKTAP